MKQLNYKMIVIFDLDYTLLDTNNFKKDLAKALSLEIDILNGSLEFLNNNKDVDTFLKSIDKFLFPESEEILKDLKQKDVELILLSFSNVRWQQKKIDNLKIKKYFKKIIITDKNKIESLNFLQNKENDIYFVNDNARESVLMKKAFPQSRIILVDGPYVNNCEHDFEIYNLKDVTKLISN